MSFIRCKGDLIMSTTTRGLLRLTILMLCVAGAWICAELVKEQAGPWPSSGQTSGASTGLCGVGPDGRSACAKVFNSKWSAVDFNIPLPTHNLTVRWSRVVLPVAFIGLAYFVFLGAWHAFAGSPRSWGRRWFLVPLTTVLAGGCGSVVFLWVLLFEVQAPCNWCLATHAINGLILLGTLCLWPRKPAPATLAAPAPCIEAFAPGQRLGLTTGAALRVMGFAVLLILGLWVYRGAKLDIRRQVARLMPYKEFVDRRQEDPAFLLREHYAQPQLAIPARSAATESETAPGRPRLVIFTDFQCPHSACFASRWRREFRDHWDGPLRMELRHFPLCPECNEAVGRQLHSQACQASYAAEAARLQGGDEAFWQMHDLLFRYGPRLEAGLYAKLAAQIDLDGERLLADMDREVVRWVVAADVALAADLGVTGTPTVFLNGRPVSQLCLYNPVFWEAVSAELHNRVTVAAGHKAYAVTDESPLAER